MHTAIDHYRVDEESRGENKVKDVMGENKVKDVKDDFIKVNNFVKDGVKGKLGSSFRDSNLVQRSSLWNELLIIQTQWFFRNEKEKVAAVENYYNNEGVADGKMVIFLIFITKYGIPFLFTVFVSVYWTFGLMKYISG